MLRSFLLSYGQSQEEPIPRLAVDVIHSADRVKRAMNFLTGLCHIGLGLGCVVATIYGGSFANKIYLKARIILSLPESPLTQTQWSCSSATRTLARASPNTASRPSSSVRSLCPSACSGTAGPPKPVYTGSCPSSALRSTALGRCLRTSRSNSTSSTRSRMRRARCRLRR